MTQATMLETESFIAAYIAAMLWAEMDNADETGGSPLDANYDREDLDARSAERIKADCVRFLAIEGVVQAIRDGDNRGPQGSGPFEMAGHDFWLTRNGHGAGFWDGDWPDPHGTTLDKAARTFAQCDVIVADDGTLEVL
jgi:hypothetical protein